MTRNVSRTKRTKFEVNGDVVTRKSYFVDVDGKETLYNESTHSLKSLNATADEIYRKVNEEKILTKIN